MLFVSLSISVLFCFFVSIKCSEIAAGVAVDGGEMDKGEIYDQGRCFRSGRVPLTIYNTITKTTVWACDKTGRNKDSDIQQWDVVDDDGILKTTNFQDNNIKQFYS